MNKLYAILFLLSIFGVNAQTKLTFSYDAAGNQTNRVLCINCTSKSVKEEIKEIEAVVEEDLEKFSEEDVISYYPNPVKEELYLQWQLTDANYVTSIKVISISGQILRTYQSSNSNNTINILFQPYPSGIYLVSLNYKSGEEKTIKIIKQ
jgi:hypothetical protein